jgi:hypothetical protein
MARKLLIRASVFLGGFGFVAGSVLFALAYFTVDIPDPNAYVNSQSTIIQYSNGEEIGRVGTQNRQIVPLAKDSTKCALRSSSCRRSQFLFKQSFFQLPELPAR